MLCVFFILSQLSGIFILDINAEISNKTQLYFQFFPYLYMKNYFQCHCSIVFVFLRFSSVTNFYFLTIQSTVLYLLQLTIFLLFIMLELSL